MVTAASSGLRSVSTAVLTDGLNSMRTGDTLRVLAPAVPAAASTPRSDAALALIHSVRNVDGDRVRVRAGGDRLVRGAVDHLAVDRISHRRCRSHTATGPGNCIGAGRDTPDFCPGRITVQVVLQCVAATSQQALREVAASGGARRELGVEGRALGA